MGNPLAPNPIAKCGHPCKYGRCPANDSCKTPSDSRPNFYGQTWAQGQQPPGACPLPLEPGIPLPGPLKGFWAVGLAAGAPPPSASARARGFGRRKPAPPVFSACAAAPDSTLARERKRCSRLLLRLHHAQLIAAGAKGLHDLKVLAALAGAGHALLRQIGLAALWTRVLRPRAVDGGKGALGCAPRKAAAATASSCIRILPPSSE